MTLTPEELAFAYTPEGHYIGTHSWAETLAKRGIIPELRNPTDGVCSIGFCEAEQKWYGWSHRAIYGFGIGSKVSKGDCAYVADTPEGLIDCHAEFFADISAECAAQHRAECMILPDRSGIRILHAPIVIPMAANMEQALDFLDGEAELTPTGIMSDAVSTIKCGRGEWTALTLEDAKQMACDFAESVS